jgi:hypothetical protein
LVAQAVDLVLFHACLLREIAPHVEWAFG